MAPGIRLYIALHRLRPLLSPGQFSQMAVAMMIFKS
jgi:hypothetical protein